MANNKVWRATCAHKATKPVAGTQSPSLGNAPHLLTRALAFEEISLGCIYIRTRTWSDMIIQFDLVKQIDLSDQSKDSREKITVFLPSCKWLCMSHFLGF